MIYISGVWLSRLLETDTIVIQLNGINQYKCYKTYFVDKVVKQLFFIMKNLRGVIKS
jgi:hypothetical protein